MSTPTPVQIPAPKQSLFIYERREMIVLTLMAIVGLLFLFTLGVHWAKKLHVIPGDASLTPAASLVQTNEERLPDFHERSDLERVSLEELDQDLTDNLQEEVKKTGIRMEIVRPLDLPKNTKSAVHSKAKPTLGPQVSLQVGQYSNLKAAEARAEYFEKLALLAQVQTVQHKGHVTYRVYLGHFESRAAAIAAGKEYISKKWIDSFVISARLAN